MGMLHSCIVRFWSTIGGVSDPPQKSSSSPDPVWPTKNACETLWVSPEKPGGNEHKGERGGKPGGTIVILPGNPGVPRYYRNFAQALADKLESEVVVLGFCGHTSKPHVPPWQVYSLENQIDNAVGFIDSICTHRTHKLRVVGHSIGAYVAIEAMRRRPQIVSYVLGLEPFLQNNPESRHFWCLSCLATLPAPIFFPLLGGIGVTLSVLSRLPQPLRKLIVSVQTGGFDPEWVDFTADAMLQPGVFSNYAFMGRTEFRHHAHHFDFVSQLGPGAAGLPPDGLIQRIRLLYTDGDMWAPTSLVKTAQAAGIHTEVKEGLPHAFSTTVKSCDWVADWSARQLQELEKTQLGQ